MKGKIFESIGSRIANAAQNGFSAMMSIFKKKVEGRHVEQPVELPVEQTPIFDAETPQMSEQVTRPKIKRLVEHDTVEEKEVKVVGKIDLDALNQRTRPIKKSRKQLERDRKIRAKENKAKNDTDS